MTEITQLAALMLITTLSAMALKKLKQPPIIGYIIAGIIAGFFLFQKNDQIIALAEVGIALLLFTVGLEIDLKKIRNIIAISTIITTVQLTLLTTIGYIAATLMGFPIIHALYIGIAISFSSTMLIVRLYQEKDAISALHARIALGVLIIQDIVAVIILAILPTLNNVELSTISISIAKGLLLLIIAVAAMIIIKKEIKKIRSEETLFLFSLSLLFGFALLSYYLDYSFAIGGFIAGLIIGTTQYNIETNSKMRPLNNFFTAIFFSILGIQISSIGLESFTQIIDEILILTAIVLILTPIIIMTIMKLAKYHRKTGFFLGTSLSQVSEFSLIIVAVGFSYNQITPEIVAIITGVAAITITITTYLIKNDEAIYKKVFKLKPQKNQDQIQIKKDTTIIFGCNRTGNSVTQQLKGQKKNLLVVEIDPEIINKLKKQKIPTMYGDAGDTEILSKIPFQNAKTIVSTIPAVKDNQLILEKIKAKNSEARTIMVADEIEDALKLYARGADHVILPHLLGGQYIKKIINEVEMKKEQTTNQKFKHIQYLHEKRTET